MAKPGELIKEKIEKYKGFWGVKCEKRKKKQNKTVRSFKGNKSTS